MIKIALIGEDPNDTTAIQNLLIPRFGSVAQFKAICENLKGYQLESAKFFKQVGIETNGGKFDLVLCIRDLDAFKSETRKVNERLKWYQKVRQSATSCKTILLLNIWELEAMLFADLELFNRKYGTSLSYTKDPTSIKDPKEKLKSETRKAKRKYVESDCRDLFCELDFNKVLSRCSFFREFILDLQSKHTSLQKLN